MKNFEVTITETFIKKIIIDAETAEQAEKWKGKIDDRAYEALMDYEVNIDD